MEPEEMAKNVDACYKVNKRINKSNSPSKIKKSFLKVNDTVDSVADIFIRNLNI